MKSIYVSKKANMRDYQVQWEIYPRIINWIRAKEGDKILDVGCGSGRLSEYFGRGANLWGVDFSKEAVKQAKNKNYKKVYLKEIHHTGFRGKEFDLTVCIQVFPYINDQDKAFRELIRITKRQIILTVPNFRWLEIKSFLLPSFRKQYLEEITKHSNPTDLKLLRRFAEKNHLECKIKYLSKQLGFVRNIFGRWFASEIVGIYNLK